MELPKKKVNWKVMAAYHQQRASALDQQLNVNTHELNKTKEEVKNLKRELRDRYIAELSQMMKANAQLGEAAARLMHPQTF